jgi:hypothetical protein
MCFAKFDNVNFDNSSSFFSFDVLVAFTTAVVVTSRSGEDSRDEAEEEDEDDEDDEDDLEIVLFRFKI